MPIFSRICPFCNECVTIDVDPYELNLGVAGKGVQCKCGNHVWVPCIVENDEEDL